MTLPLTEFVQKATTLSSNVQTLIPQIWAAQIEINLRKAAVLEQSLIVNEDLLVPNAGDTVYIPILPDLGPATALTEGTDIVPIALTNSTSIPMVPTEYGSIVEITRKALDRMKYNGIEEIMNRLVYSMSQTIEGQIAALATAVVPGTASSMAQVYANGKTSTTLATTDTINDALLHTALTQLEQANNFPFPDGYYRLYVSPKQANDLFEDSNIRNDLRWGASERLFRGEIGQVAGIRIIATNYIAPTTINSITAYQAMLVAPRWASIAYKRRPEAYVDPTLYDGGRRRRFGIISDHTVDLIHAERGIVLVTA